MMWSEAVIVRTLEQDACTWGYPLVDAVDGAATGLRACRKLIVVIDRRAPWSVRRDIVWAHGGLDTRSAGRH